LLLTLLVLGIEAKPLEVFPKKIVPYSSVFSGEILSSLVGASPHENWTSRRCVGFNALRHTAVWGHFKLCLGFGMKWRSGTRIGYFP
jgi:hypothetical protein